MGLEWLHRLCSEPRRLAMRHRAMPGCCLNCFGVNGAGLCVTPVPHCGSAAIFAGMHRSNILVVVVDGLRASALGAYGNTTFPTPALDRFAADSLLLDRCYSPSAELEQIYHALWLSEHPGRAAALPAAALSGKSRSLPAIFGGGRLSHGAHHRRIATPHFSGRKTSRIKF